ncbi:MAG: 2TM domain-containing protein [Bacteroidota bacterium]
MNEEDIFYQAKKKVKAKKGFFYHFLAYACIIGMLAAIMYFDGSKEVLPVIIVGLSWGIGIAIHYFSVFGTENLGILGINPNWEEDELEQEIKKLKRKRELKESLRNEQQMLDDLDNFELKDLKDIEELEKRPLDDSSNEMYKN